MTNEQIFKFRNILREKIERIEKNLKSLESPYGFSGGIYDDEDEKKRINEYNTAYDKLTSAKATTESIWNDFKLIIGEYNINIAIQECEQRIGKIPYVK